MLNHRATLAQWAPQLCNEAAQLLWIVFAIAVLQTEERLQHAALAILAHTRILWALQTATCARWPNTRAWKLRSMSPLACSVQATLQPKSTSLGECLCVVGFTGDPANGIRVGRALPTPTPQSGGELGARGKERVREALRGRSYLLM